MKHAYLIMAHNHFDQLAKLLHCLDHPENDIFIHIDKKASYDCERLATGIHFSRVFFTERIKVNWGGYSIVEAELLLLEAAIACDQYCRYHLISGADLPLCSQEEIHNYFDSKSNLEYIGMTFPLGSGEDWVIDRIKYYYPFQDCFSRRSIIGKVLRRGLLFFQKLLKVNRLRNTDMLFGKGSQFFSITDKFAKYAVTQREPIEKLFANGYCVDEMFLQWVYLHWDNPNPRYCSSKKNHPYIHEDSFDICRAIDWARGSPYVYRIEDYQMLLDSKCLFARKFDESVDSEIIDAIIAHIEERSRL